MTQRSCRFPTGTFDSLWWQLYERAILEQDCERVAARIESAVSAIHTRHVELKDCQDDGHERAALIEARNTLTVLEILREAEEELTRDKPSQPKNAA
jgi:hypothetical protein